ncbi:MAG: tetratricopeptide repeat protein [Magnetococcales bacterium]|nr:tetratricopeptide repeat protein [Magnetococcales bacterium]
MHLMPPPPSRPFVLFQQAFQDAALLDALTPHLEVMRWEGLIRGWDVSTKLDAERKSLSFSPDLVIHLVHADADATENARLPDRNGSSSPTCSAQSSRQRPAESSLKIKEDNIAPGVEEIRRWIASRFPLLSRVPGLDPDLAEMVPDTDEIAFRPPPPNNLPLAQTFIGRHNELELLRNQFLSGTLAVTGPEGIGKTALALEFAHRCMHDFKLVWWIRGHAPELIEEDLLSLAVLLNLQQGSIQEQQARLEEFFQRNSHWLLIVDEAFSPKDVRPLLPKSRNGRILVTSSQEKRWHGMVDVLCPLHAFSPEEGVTCLSRKMGRDLGPDGADLVNELQGNPLEISLAAAWMVNTNRDCANLLTALHRPHKSRKSSLERLGWLALQELEVSSPLAAKLLEVLVFFETDIPLSVLIAEQTSIPGVSKELPLQIESWQHAVQVLVNLDLVQIHEALLQVHPGIRALVLETLSERQQRSRAAAALHLIDRNFAWRCTAREAWRRPGHLVPLAAVTALRASHWGVEAETIAQILNQAGVFYHGWENYNRAMELLQYAMSLVEKAYGPDHPAIASCANNLGAVLEDMGDLRGARLLLERALRIDETFYGATHTNVAINASNLAAVLLNLGETDRAVELFKQALHIHTLHQGADHPDLACHFHNLGQVYRRMEAWDQARDLLERAVKAYRAGLGPDHPDTRLCQEDLANLP